MPNLSEFVPIAKRSYFMSERLSPPKSLADFNSDRALRPEPSALVETLLAQEKLTKKEKINYDFTALIGCWNLCFITGTKKSRERGGIVLGSGKYLPKWIRIDLTYQLDSNSEPNCGRVKNSVSLGFLNLSLTGPVKFIRQNNILAFDFTAIAIKILGLTIYDGYLKNGATKDREFFDRPIKKQAFFHYFLIQENLIAARGRGGGLALWVKDLPS